MGTALPENERNQRGPLRGARAPWGGVAPALDAYHTWHPQAAHLPIGIYFWHPYDKDVSRKQGQKPKARPGHMEGGKSPAGHWITEPNMLAFKRC